MFGFLPGPSFCCRKAASTYRMHFCGLCNGLHRDYGLWARWLINRDSTFLALLGSALASEAPTTCRTTCCNPWGASHELLDSGPSLHYAAAVTICGLTTKIDDDSEDERGSRRWLAKLGGHVLSDTSARALGILHSLNFPVASVFQSLQTHPLAEQQGVSLIEASQPTQAAFGQITAHIGHLTSSENSTLAVPLREIGQQLGFLIYTKDAWDDWTTDQQRGRYNPLRSLASIEDRRAHLAPLLQQSLATLSRAFQSLPLHRHHDLLSQVLMDGASTRVNEILGNPNQVSYLTHLESRNKRDEDKKGKNDCCSSCDCCECCHFPCRSSSGASKLCDCNPCDGDGCGCCGCDCDCGCG